MDNLLKNIEKVLEKAPENRHSFFQLHYFVIGKEVTNQGRMWQCLRELQSRKETIDHCNFQIEEMKDQLDLMEIELGKIDLGLEPGRHGRSDDALLNALYEREWEVRCRKHDRTKKKITEAITQMEQKKQYAIQEAKFFLQAFEAINQQEPLKDFDDPDAQKEYWNEKISQQINLKMLLGQPLNTEQVTTALALPEDCPVKMQITRSLDQAQTQVEMLKQKYVERLKEHDVAAKNNER